MNTITSRAITAATACAMFGGQCGCVYMSDQLGDYPFDDYGMVLPMNVVLASAAPVVNTIADDRRLNEATGKEWYQPNTTRDYLRVALTCKNADMRRFAVLKIIGSGDVASDWAFDGLETVARQDSSSSVRWVAIRGLSRVNDPRPVRVALSILNHERGTDNVRPPDVRVRWACLLLLDDCCTRGLVRDAHHEAVRDVMVRHLSRSYHHDVQWTAAKGLRHFEDKASRTALTHVLKDGHLGVAQRAKRSLQALADAEHIGSDRRKEVASITSRSGPRGQSEHRVGTSNIAPYTLKEYVFDE